MAKADQIKALVRSHAEGDDGRFYAVALQMAAQAARSGQGKFASDLKELIDQAKSQRSAVTPRRTPGVVPLVQPKGDLAELLSVSYLAVRINDMSLTNELRAKLERVIIEQRQRERLRSFGFAPLRKLLLIGPPGTGKTMTASALSGELGLPLFTIRLDGLLTKFMGETAAKLRLIFDAVEMTRGVYFFDEFDALGGQRGLSNDVGEIRRVLNSFLQFLEREESDSLVLAATNHADLLDQALFRRFDAIVEYSLPDATTSIEVMQARLATLKTGHVDWDKAGRAAEHLSHAEITRACEQAAKVVLLSNEEEITTFLLVRSLEERRRTRP